MKHFIKTYFPCLFEILHNVRYSYYCFLGKFFPKMLVKTWYKRVHGKPINLEEPQTLDEKINWMKFNSDMSLWTRCADKYEVRKYVEEKGLGFTLNEIYGVYNKPEDIDFGSLPNQFVIKTTNGGGGRNVLIVKDKDTLDIKHIQKKLNDWLKQKAYYRYYEPHYKGIQPKLIVEKLLKPSEGISLNDIKMRCYNGKVYTICVCSDRDFHGHVCYSDFDVEWNRLKNVEVQGIHNTTAVFKKPKSFEKMIEYSQILSEGIPFVRIDWYDIDGIPYFGEMTFTPSGGFAGHDYTWEYQKEMGKPLILPRKM